MDTEFLPQLTGMRHYFETGITKPYAFRKQQLLALKNAVINYEQEIYDALHSDLKKSKEESWVTENGFFLAELNDTLHHLKKWMEPEAASTNLLNMPSSSYIMHEPLG